MHPSSFALQASIAKALELYQNHISMSTLTAQAFQRCVLVDLAAAC
jgi:hypothetical protein